MPSWAGYFVILDEAGNGIPIGSLSSEELTRVKVGQSGCYIYPFVCQFSARISIANVTCW